MIEASDTREFLALISISFSPFVRACNDESRVKLLMRISECEMMLKLEHDDD